MSSYMITKPGRNDPKNKRRGIRLDPALRAALIWLGPSILMRFAAGLLGYPWVSWLLQIAVYTFCGYMAASAYYQSIKSLYPKGRPTISVRCGAKAGITLGILLSVFLVLFMLIFSLLLPAGLLATISLMAYIIMIPADIFGGLFLGALGGKISASARK
jgi:4-hydroxybenzoate polyprenyltransferase